MIFRGLKLKRIGNRAGKAVNSEAKEQLMVLMRQIRGTGRVELLNPTLGPDQMFFEALSLLSCYGTTVVEHYSRNYIDEQQRISKLVPGLVKTLTLTLFRDQVLFLKSAQLYTLHSLAQELLGPITIKYGNCAVIHRQCELDEHWSTCATGVCTMLIFASLINPELLPEQEMETFDEIPQALRDILLDISNMVTNYHAVIHFFTSSAFIGARFTQVRDLGHYM